LSSGSLWPRTPARRPSRSISPTGIKGSFYRSFYSVLDPDRHWRLADQELIVGEAVWSLRGLDSFFCALSLVKINLYLFLVARSHIELRCAVGSETLISYLFCWRSCSIKCIIAGTAILVTFMIVWKGRTVKLRGPFFTVNTLLVYKEQYGLFTLISLSL
jgi:hypothetical protein